MKNILNTAIFYSCVGLNNWHSFKNDRATKNAIKSLIKHGYLETNEFNQARLIKAYIK
jgi:hypothetical protein